MVAEAIRSAVAFPRAPPRRFLLALGGNVGDVAAAFRRAAALLDATAGIGLLAYSRLYRTKALVLPGAPAQPDYLNAVCLGHTTLALGPLWAAIAAIERSFGPRSTVRWAPRCLDLDLVDDEQNVHSGAPITVPHPRALTRSFVLAPAADVAPEWRLGQQKCTLTELLRRLPADTDAPLGAALSWRCPPAGA